MTAKLSVLFLAALFICSCQQRSNWTSANQSQASNTCLQQHVCNIALTWSPSTSTGVTGYKVYWGTSSGNYSQSQDVGALTSAVLASMNQGTYYIAVTAYNGEAESAFSTEVVVQVPPSFNGGVLKKDLGAPGAVVY